MKRRIFTTMALVCCIMICLAAVTELAGKWSGKINAPDGTEVVLNYNFKVDGNKLTGTAESQGSEVTIDSGKISGSDITFSVTNTEGMVIPHKGKYYGDSIGMDIDFNGTKFHSTLLRDSK